jgi:hypothetical protein
LSFLNTCAKNIDIFKVQNDDVEYFKNITSSSSSGIKPHPGKFDIFLMENHSHVWPLPSWKFSCQSCDKKTIIQLPPNVAQLHLVTWE